MVKVRPAQPHIKPILSANLASNSSTLKTTRQPSSASCYPSTAVPSAARCQPLSSRETKKPSPSARSASPSKLSSAGSSLLVASHQEPSSSRDTRTPPSLIMPSGDSATATTRGPSPDVPVQQDSKRYVMMTFNSTFNKMSLICDVPRCYAFLLDITLQTVRLS